MPRKSVKNKAIQAQPKRKGGQQSKYSPDMAKRIAVLCRMGATDVDIADFFTVDIRTVERWRVEHDSMRRASKAGKGPADDRVERSLYQRAIGYTYESERQFHYQGKVIRAAVREHVPPDTTACIFWLKNRRREEWRDRYDADHSHTHGITGEFEAFIRSLSRAPAKLIEHVAEPERLEMRVLKST